MKSSEREIESHKKQVSRYQVRIDCPVSGRFYGKEFILIYELDNDIEDEIYTVTLFPWWN